MKDSEKYEELIVLISGKVKIEDTAVSIKGGQCFNEYAFLNHGRCKGNYKIISEKLIYL